jgi:hypothetical protein
VGSGENGSDVCGVCCVEAIVGGGRFALKGGGERGGVGECVGEEAFAGGSDEDGKVELAEALEVREDRVVLVEAFAEAEAGVEDDFFLGDAGRDGRCEAFLEFSGDEGYNFAEREFGECGPVLRATSGVHEDGAAVEFGAGRGHGGVPEVAANVVDDLGAGFDGEACGGRVVGVDGEDGGGALFEDGFDDREDAGLFFFGREGDGVRPRGFAAEVEDVGAFVEHAEGAGESAFGSMGGGVEETAVGEGVGRDVEDAHDEGSAAQSECAGAEVPVVTSPGGEGHGGILW